MGYKFFDTTPDEPDFGENYVPEPIDNTVYLRLERNRDTISDEEWNSIIQRQRTILMDYMWEHGMVSHTIISQDENGLTLRTELIV